MKRTWTIIGVADVPGSMKWYQSLLGLPETAAAHHDFGQIVDTDGTVLLCLHEWGAHEHPSLISSDHTQPGNGLLLFFRVDDFDMALPRACALVARLEDEPHLNPNTGTAEFSLRDPDGYYVTLSALSAAEGCGHFEESVGVNSMAKKKSIKSTKVATKAAAKRVAKPALLAGGNPQIAKADGDAPVQAYIAAMPGWKSDVGRRLDALIVRTIPGVRKAIKWNSPFYGIEGQGWFLNFHCFTKYVKVAFFRGTSLRPLPPGQSKHEEVRYLDIREDARLDEAQVAGWVKQASQLPGGQG